MTSTRRALLAAPLAAAVARPATGGSYFPAPDAKGGWRTLKDAGQVRKTAGMDLTRLEAAFEYTSRTSAHGGLLVARHGWLVYEKYFGRGGRETTPNMYSCGKTFTSLCCGILMAERKSKIPEGLEQKVFNEQYLPEALPLDDSRKAEIKLGHLLAMTSGMRDGTSGIVRGEVKQLPPMPKLDRTDQDLSAVRMPMWTEPGGGYSYSSQGVHVASMIVRRLAGMEMKDYVGEKLAGPMEFGGWGFATEFNGQKLPHTPGGFGSALRATDALRFAQMLLRGGRWGGRQLVPADYMALCRKPSPYNPHSPYSLQFEVNEDGHVAGAPRDTFFKSGAGGFCVYAVPSLDLAVYKMASVGSAAQYDLGYGGKTEKVDTSRDDWKPRPMDQFHDGPVNGDAGTRRTLEMVIAAIVG